MSIKVIPEKRLVICDACLIHCDVSIGFLRKHEGRLIVRQHALDRYGNRAADGTYEMDLCDNCLASLNQALDRELAKIRSGHSTPIEASP